MVLDDVLSQTARYSKGFLSRIPEISLRYFTVLDKFSKIKTRPGAERKTKQSKFKIPRKNENLAVLLNSLKLWKSAKTLRLRNLVCCILRLGTGNSKLRGSKNYQKLWTPDSALLKLRKIFPKKQLEK